jgi:hypothetical protein
VVGGRVSFERSERERIGLWAFWASGRAKASVLAWPKIKFLYFSALECRL